MPLASELPLNIGDVFVGEVGSWRTDQSPCFEFTVTHMPSGGEFFGKWMLVSDMGHVFPSTAVLVDCATAGEIIENAKSTVNWDDY